MGSVQMFEAMLKEVVQAKRLSASKMTKLTDISMKSLSHDTELVLVLFKTHKGLAASQKVSSLYVFDALVRAAHNYVVKHSVVADSAPGRGNAATFLAKIEGIVEGLFEDMMSCDAPEAQEKTKKILDIWIKANALPPAMLKRLGDIAKGKATDQKEPPNENLMSIDPRSNRSPTSSITPPIPTHAPALQTQLPQPIALPPTPTQITPGSEGLQSTLLALLNQAATQPNGNNLQTGANNNTAQSADLLNSAGLDVNQLALLQQLARAAKDGAGGPTPHNQIALPLPLVTGNGTFPPGPVPSTSALAPIDLQAYGNSRPASVPTYESEGRYQGGGRHYSDDYHRRDGGRGRGRGRGRSGYHGGWDDRSTYRERDRDDRESLSPRRHVRHGRSRSRSPPRGPRRGDIPRRDQRGRSPTGTDPRRPPTPTLPTAVKSHGPEKDEFGRDLRPGSADPEPLPTSATQPVFNTAKTAATTMQGSSAVRDLSPSQQNPVQPTPIPSITNGAQPEAAMPIATYESRDKDTNTTKGLEGFDFTAFDFTSPTAWGALGKAWEVTNGVVPTQEMLMQFVMMMSMSMGTGMGAGASGFGMGQPDDQWNGVQGSTSEGWNAGGVEWSDGGAEVVGETQDQENPDGETASPEEDTPTPEVRSVGSTGKMQKVGDRWVFVRS